MRRTGSRYAAAAVSFFFLTFCTLELAGNLELVLTHKSMRPYPLQLLSGLTQRGLLLWILLDALGCLGIWWALYGQSYLDYHSRMVEIVPGFQAPAPDGQGQHGTAWWLPAQDFDRVFESIDTSRPIPLTEELAAIYAAERDELGGNL